jgi:hypothetical protein
LLLLAGLLDDGLTTGLSELDCWKILRGLSEVLLGLTKPPLRPLAGWMVPLLVGRV